VFSEHRHRLRRQPCRREISKGRVPLIFKSSPSSEEIVITSVERRRVRSSSNSKQFLSVHRTCQRFESP
jgi:hypothetical protein